MHGFADTFRYKLNAINGKPNRKQSEFFIALLPKINQHLLSIDWQGFLDPLFSIIEKKSFPKTLNTLRIIDNHGLIDSTLKEG